MRCPVHKFPGVSWRRSWPLKTCAPLPLRAGALIWRPSYQNLCTSPTRCIKQSSIGCSPPYWSIGPGHGPYVVIWYVCTLQGHAYITLPNKGTSSSIGACFFWPPFTMGVTTQGPSHLHSHPSLTSPPAWGKLLKHDSYAWSWPLVVLPFPVLFSMVSWIFLSWPFINIISRVPLKLCKQSPVFHPYTIFLLFFNMQMGLLSPCLN